MSELKQDLVEVEGLFLSQKQAYEYYKAYFSEHPEKLLTRTPARQRYYAFIQGDVAWFFNYFDDGKVVTDTYLMNSDIDCAFTMDVKDCLNLHLTEDVKVITLEVIQL